MKDINKMNRAQMAEYIGFLRMMIRNLQVQLKASQIPSGLPSGKAEKSPAGTCKIL